MIASILPLATTLEKTGAIDLVTDAIVESSGLTSSLMLLLLLFAFTSLLSQAISNTEAIVLLTFSKWAFLFNC